MRITYCDRCGKETESPIRTLCKKCWTELEEELHYPKTPYITNADRIRSMTDEELAELLRDYQCNTCDFNGFCEETEKCEEEIFEWLQSESGEA